MDNFIFTPLDMAAVLIVMVAVIGFLNEKFVRLPPSIAMTAIGALGSLAVIAIDWSVPGAGAAPKVASFIDKLDFHSTLMNGMLAFLLFAGALHVDWREMSRGRWLILALSTIGVLISTALVGGGFYLLSNAMGFAVPWLWCLVFGALISPTDPVAVMAVLHRTACPASLKATVAGESLFNDGVGVVVFTILAGAALGHGGHFTALGAFEEFLMEAGGGVILGLAVGWLGFLAMRSIDEYNVELIITLAVVMGGYAIARLIHVSGPVAMAVAGLLTGNAAVAHAMTEPVRDHILKFWAMIDELLNAVLFLLIGLVLVAVQPEPRVALLGALCIPLVMLARFVSVLLPLKTFRALLGKAAIPTLVWGGLRGGISVALALSLPPGPARGTILAATYVVVLFSVLVQGGSIGRVIKKLTEEPPCAPEPEEAAIAQQVAAR